MIHNLTAAPRSNVIHAIDSRPGVSGHVTYCGRRIGDEWAGEYTEAPTGPVTCKRCAPVVESMRELALARRKSMAAHPAGKGRTLTLAGLPAHRVRAIAETDYNLVNRVTPGRDPISAQTVVSLAERNGERILPPVPGVWFSATGEAYREGVCDWASESALVTTVAGIHGNIFICNTHRHLIDDESERALDEDASRWFDRS